MSRRGINLVEGPVGRHMVSLGVFLALSVVANMATLLVDTYFVSQLGHRELAALSFTFPIQLIVGAISMGMGNGIVAVTARAVGEGDHNAIQKLGTDSVLLGIAIITVIAVVGYFTIAQTFTLMGATPEVLPFIDSYMRIWYWSAWVQIIPVIAQGIIRAHGDTRTTGLITAAMCAINAVLDPIFIFGWGPIPAMGLDGAAYANVASRVYASLAILYVLQFRLHGMAPIVLTAQRLRDTWGKILYIGLPSTASQLVMPVSAAIITKIIALSGIVAVAAYGVATRIELMTAIYLWAVAGAMPSFVGQNMGAKRMDRVQEAVRIAVKFSLAAGVVVFALIMVAGSHIIAQFSDDPVVNALALDYLRIASVSYALGGLVTVASQTLSSMHYPMPAAIINLARTAVVTVPLALLGHWLGHIHGVFIGISASGIICGVGSWIVMASIVKREVEREARDAAGNAMGNAT